MIEKDKIKWIKQDGRTQAHYKGLKLDLSAETIQDIYHGVIITEKEIEKIISDSYQRCLRIHREKLLKQLLDDKVRK
jgi:hypothetical protein